MSSSLTPIEISFGRLYYENYSSFPEVCQKEYVSPILEEMAPAFKYDYTKSQESNITVCLTGFNLDIKEFRKKILIKFFKDYLKHVYSYSEDVISKPYNWPKDFKLGMDYTIEFYLDLGNNIILPLYEENNYTKDPDHGLYFNPESPFPLLSFYDLPNHIIAFTQRFPIMRFTFSDKDYICFNALYYKNDSERFIPIIDFECLNKFRELNKDKYDKPLDELVIEYNYYHQANLQKVVKIVSDEVYLL